MSDERLCIQIGLLLIFAKQTAALELNAARSLTAHLCASNGLANNKKRSEITQFYAHPFECISIIWPRRVEQHPTDQNMPPQIIFDCVREFLNTSKWCWSIRANQILCTFKCCKRTQCRTGNTCNASTRKAFRKNMRTILRAEKNNPNGTEENS